MSDARWWLVCYDVRDAKRLRRCARHMEGYGERVQYSVFRCWMTKRESERLRWELTELLDAADDVLVIPICGSCAAGVSGIRLEERRPEWPAEPPRHRLA